MKPLSEQSLHQENVVFQGTGGRSEENRSRGFRPAFLDSQTSIVYLSRFADGRPAPVHILDGLPEEVVISRGANGRITKVKASVESGFVLDGNFYTRESAARAMQTRDWRAAA